MDSTKTVMEITFKMNPHGNQNGNGYGNLNAKNVKDPKKIIKIDCNDFGRDGASLR